MCNKCGKRNTLYFMRIDLKMWQKKYCHESGLASRVCPNDTQFPLNCVTDGGDHAAACS